MLDFPIIQYVILFGILLGLCLAVSLLIAGAFSEDKETGIIKQLWQTFFSSEPPNTPLPPQVAEKPPQESSEQQ